MAVTVELPSSSGDYIENRAHLQTLSLEAGAITGDFIAVSCIFRGRGREREPWSRDSVSRLVEEAGKVRDRSREARDSAREMTARIPSITRTRARSGMRRGLRGHGGERKGGKKEGIFQTDVFGRAYADV